MYTTGQVVIFLSILYIIIFSGFACAALYEAWWYSLPQSTYLPSMTLFLLCLTGISLKYAIPILRPRSRNSPTPGGSPSRTRTRALCFTAIFIIVFSASIATLAGFYIAPADNLTWQLDGTWQRLFERKNEAAVRSIQDKLKCCGLMSTKDRAWPFPARNVGVGACVDRFPERKDTPCFAAWRGIEQQAASFLLTAAIGVGVWSILILLYFSSYSPPWHSRRRPSERSENADSPQRTQLPQPQRPATWTYTIPGGSS